MKDWRGKRYWLVGASEGLGRALAERLSREGVALVLSARNAEALAELAAALPSPAQAVPMDVTDAGSVRAAAAAAGEVDGVVYLAALYWPMRAQDWDADKAAAMCDVNLTGAVRVLGAVAPGMAARGAGHIVLTGSLSGFRGLHGAIGYASSKAGVMHLAECLRADLQGSGVDVQLVNPGFIRTRLTARNDFAMPFIMEPEEAAKHVFAHMNRRGFARSFPAAFSLIFRLAALIPHAPYFRLAARWLR